MALLDFLVGKKDKIKQMPNFDPEQMAFIKDILKGAQSGNQQALQWFNSILSDEPGANADFERPALEEFEQETIPSILERFTGRGAGSSSALNQALGQAGKGLQTNLAAQRANLKNTAVQGLQNYAQMGLQKLNTPYLQQGTQGLLGQFAGSQAGQDLVGEGINSLFSGGKSLLGKGLNSLFGGGR